jgi:glyoxylase-like metal-dependent hydrolase (beta-lactamase superfamily II)
VTDPTTDRNAWTEPGAFEVAPDVFRIPLPLPNDGLRAVNVYAVRTGDGFVLVDAGWDIPESRALLAESLDGLGASLADIRRFLVTHVHRDHYTQAIVVRREFGSTVGLGIGEKPTLDLLQSPERSPLMGQVRHLRVLGAPDLADTITGFVGNARPDLEQWESPDDWLEPGQIALTGGRVLEAVPTPGHTAGHLVFHDVAAGLLFAGDHVLPTITPSIGFEPVLSPEPLGAFLRSLALVRSRPDALLLPAHGPVAPSAHARVDELIDHHGRRLDEVQEATKTGASTAFEVAGVLRWTRREHKLADLDPFNAMLAVFETGAHLDLLVTQERLTVTHDGVVRRYR